MNLQEQINRIQEMMELNLKSKSKESLGVFNIDNSSNPYSDYGTNVVTVANKFEKGGYHWGSGSSGVCVPLKFDDKVLMDKGIGSHCCGFTLSVAFIVALNRGLLNGKSVSSIRKFFNDWYGAGGAFGKLCVTALIDLGIGKEVNLENVVPGDFCQIWRKDGGGHSVIFLKHIMKNEKIIGIEYRSSQPNTNGIGNNIEYFTDGGGSVLKNKTYFGRMN
jgi:hypothetical protein